MDADHIEPGSVLMDGERNAYRMIEYRGGLPWLIRQTPAGAHDMTSRLPEGAYYVYDAAAPHRM